MWETETFGFLFDLDPHSSAPVCIGAGLGAIGLGATSMAVGVHRNKRFGAWRRETSLARTNIAPIFGPMRGGLQLGLRGEF